MKILLYVNSYLPQIGGREIVVHMLASHLHRLGHDVRVVGPAGWYSQRNTQFEYPLQRWWHLPFLGKQLNWTAHLLRTCLLTKFDVVHAHNTYPTGYTAALVKRFLRAPLIITPHGSDINIAPEINHGLRLDPVVNAKIELALANADAVTAISDQVAKSLQDAGVNIEDIHYLPNGVDIDRFQASQPIDVRNHFGLADNTQIVVTVGNYRPLKGHEVLINSIKIALLDNPNLVLVIVGESSDHLNQQATIEGIGDRVKFTGSIPLPLPDQPDLLAALLQEADVYVSSSLSDGAEGMSLAVLEAMAAGACVVATRISGNIDLLGDGKRGYLVEPNSPQALAEGILCATANNEEANEFICRAKIAVREYSWEAIAKQYVQIYRQVAL